MTEPADQRDVAPAHACLRSRAPWTGRLTSGRPLRIFLPMTRRWQSKLRNIGLVALVLPALAMLLAAPLVRAAGFAACHPEAAAAMAASDHPVHDHAGHHGEPAGKTHHGAGDSHHPASPEHRSDGAQRNLDCCLPAGALVHAPYTNDGLTRVVIDRIGPAKAQTRPWTWDPSALRRPPRTSDIAERAA